ncbi:MAG: formate dehydrogenase accessory protein FdhE [Desulfobacterales bacterium]|nr:formate dehydrogenase accessory protein FdhE [Desulfobacterales bacterium]
MQNHRETLLQKADRIRQEKILDDKSIEFYSDLFEFHYSKTSIWMELNAFPSVDDILNISIESGLTGIPDIAIEELTKSIAELGAIIKHSQGIDTDKAVNDFSAGRSNIEQTIGFILKKSSDDLVAMSKTAQMDYEKYIFLVVNWLKPFLIAFRKNSAKMIKDDHGNYRECPFCGYYPDISLISLEKDGSRYLRCGLCENLWRYKRIACAVCGNEDAKKLEYFTGENNDRYRLDVCHSCSGYIKTVRLNKTEDIEHCDLTIENILSAPLETLLMQKGYMKL